MAHIFWGFPRIEHRFYPCIVETMVSVKTMAVQTDKAIAKWHKRIETKWKFGNGGRKDDAYLRRIVRHKAGLAAQHDGLKTTE